MKLDYTDTTSFYECYTRLFSVDQSALAVQNIYDDNQPLGMTITTLVEIVMCFFALDVLRKQNVPFGDKDQHASLARLIQKLVTF